MCLANDLKDLVNETRRVNSESFTAKDGLEFPGFITAHNGNQMLISRKMKEIIRKFSKNVVENRKPEEAKIEIANYAKIFTQVLADMTADRRFDTYCETMDKAVLKELKAQIEKQIDKASEEYTHYFPAWTLRMEAIEPFELGPVSFLDREKWVDSVEFPPNANNFLVGSPEQNHNWKNVLKEALTKPKDSTQLEGIASLLYDPISECPSLLKVTIKGYEREFSRKLAKLVCKSALDAISLCYSPDFFYQQVLQEERVPPISSFTLVETEGFLWSPGHGLSLRIRSRSPNQANNDIKQMPIPLRVFGSILDALVNPSSHKHPKLASRWATALDWFGEGCRETSDAIAVTKLATCLDVLTCGGKSDGITAMVAFLSKSEKDKIFMTKPSRTLEELIKDIYGAGRSKILHGTHFDRLKSFEEMRKITARLARDVLIESATRLYSFTGEDEDKAFKTMPAMKNDIKE